MSEDGGPIVDRRTVLVGLVAGAGGVGVTRVTSGLMHSGDGYECHLHTPTDETTTTEGTTTTEETKTTEETTTTESAATEDYAGGPDTRVGTYTYVGDALLPSDGGWDSEKVYHPHAEIVDGTIYLFYSGAAGYEPVDFGLATSPTDTIDFQRHPDNPLMTTEAGTFYERRLETPSFWLDNGTWRMNFGGVSNDGRRIGTAISPDGISWSIDSEPLLEPVADSWESSDVAHPHRIDGTGTLLYGANDNPKCGCDWNVGLATVENDGSVTRYSGNPVAVPTDANGGVYTALEEMAVYETATADHVLIGAYDAGWHILHAYSTDGFKTWQWDPGNPVIEGNPHATHPTMIQRNGGFDIFHMVDDETRRIGHTRFDFD